MKNISIAAMLMAVLTIGLTASALAGKADVIDVRARAAGDDKWSFDVTIKHADTGWSHYADNFEVLAPDGKLLGRRTLFHPHVTEQPFTRSLTGVVIPKSMRRVHIRAHDLEHGFGGREMDVELTK